MISEKSWKPVADGTVVGILQPDGKRVKNAKIISSYWHLVAGACYEIRYLRGSKKSVRIVGDRLRAARKRKPKKIRKGMKLKRRDRPSA